MLDDAIYCFNKCHPEEPYAESTDEEIRWMEAEYRASKCSGGDWDAVVAQYETRRPGKVGKWQGKWQDVIRNQPGHMFTFSPYDRSIRPQSKMPPCIEPFLTHYED